MKYYQLLLAVAILASSLIVCSCVSKRKATDADRLTKEEEQMLVQNARDILLNSKQFKFSKEERAFIANTKPETGFNYTAYKEGRGLLSWQFTEKKRVNLKVEGEFLEPDRQWQINIIRTEETQFVAPRKSQPVTPEEFKK